MLSENISTLDLSLIDPVRTFNSSVLFPSYSSDQFIPENYQLPVELNNTYFDENFDLISQQNDNLETLIQNLETNVINNSDQQIWDVVTDFDHKLDYLANQSKDDFEELQESMWENLINLKTSIKDETDSLQDKVNELEGMVVSLTNVVQSIPFLIEGLLFTASMSNFF